MSWEDFLRALEGDESNGSSAKQHVDRGKHYMDQKQYVLALQEFDNAIQLDPNNVLAFCWRGLVHIAMRNYAQAENDFNVASRLAPDYVPALASLGDLHIRIALEMLERAFYFCRANPQMYQNLASHIQSSINVIKQYLLR